TGTAPAVVYTLSLHDALPILRVDQPVRCVGNAMDSESRHVFFQPVEVLRQERWVVHSPNYECGYVSFCTPRSRAVARRRSCETIGSVIVQTAGDRTGLRPSLDIFGFVFGRKAVLPSECHHPAQELEIICGQNLLCLGATEEF